MPASFVTSKSNFKLLKYKWTYTEPKNQCLVLGESSSSNIFLNANWLF